MQFWVDCVRSYDLVCVMHWTLNIEHWILFVSAFGIVPLNFVCRHGFEHKFPMFNVHSVRSMVVILLRPAIEAKQCWSIRTIIQTLNFKEYSFDQSSIQCSKEGFLFVPSYNSWKNFLQTVTASNMHWIFANDQLIVVDAIQSGWLSCQS